MVKFQKLDCEPSSFFLNELSKFENNNFEFL